MLLADFWYYRSGDAIKIILSLAIAFTFSLAWQGWQRYYFGEEVYLLNLEKLRALSAAVYGIHPSRIISSVKTFITIGPFYLWGLAGWLYQIPFLIRKSNRSKVILYLWTFFIFWLIYTIVFVAPHSQIPLMGTSIMAIFIACMISDFLKTTIEFIREKR